MNHDYKSSGRGHVSESFDVGLYGLWFGHNYGSMLTYFALNKLLTSFGLSVLMIENPLLTYSGGTLPVNHPNMFAQNHGYHIHQALPLARMRELNTICNTFMVGADQLWNYFLSRPLGHSYFLEFAAEDKTKIAYGTSFGTLSYNGPNEERPVVGSLLRRFDHLSVRDDSSVHICKHEFAIDATKVIDPVFLCPDREYDTLAEQAQLDTPDDYILAYVLDPNPEFGKALSAIADKSGVPVLIVLDFLKKRFADNYEKLSIHEAENIRVLHDVRSEDFIHLMKNASFVITDSFHGCCFSILYQKDFICRKNINRAPMRFGSLLSPLSLTANLVDDESLILELFLNYKRIDYETVNVILNQQRKNSLDWLLTALDIPESRRRTNRPEA